MPRDAHRVPTLGDLITSVEDDPSLAARTKQDWVSSIRLFVTRLGKGLDLIASPMHLRQALKGNPPRDVKRKTWANIRSNVGAALRHAGDRPFGIDETLPHAEWASLRGKLPSPRFERGLSRFLNWCIATGVTPGQVSASTLDAFRNYLETQTLLRTPQKQYRDTTQLWNRLVHSMHDWPQVLVPVPSRREVITYGEHAFPKTFRDDLAAWERRVSGRDRLNDAGPAKPLRPATYRGDRTTFVRCASILVREGLDASEIKTLAVLVQPENTRTILQFHLNRHNNDVTRGVEKVAHTLLTLARHWVRLTGTELEEIEDLARRLSLKTRGMSDRSKQRLRQFDDPRTLAELIRLPWVLRDLARAAENPTRAATTMRLAVLIAVALSAPVRRRNLSNLHLDQHISIRRNRRKIECHLHFPASETKTKVDLDFALNPKVTELLLEYRDRYRARLVKNDDDRWLFPGEISGKALTPEALTDHLTKAISKHLGVTVNIHLFRHLAAKIYLSQHPEDLATVQQLLGHKQTQTTIDFYCEFDRARAIQRYDTALFGEDD